jgi:hypothetical protein
MKLALLSLSLSVQTPFAVSLESVAKYQPIEQQTPGGATQPDQSLWVVNPTDCVWDPDDHIEWRGFGDLEAGGSDGASGCILGDWKAHVTSVNVVSRSPNLAVEIVLEGDGLRFTAVPVPTLIEESGPRRYRYEACLYGPDYSNHELPPVEGSNGGVAVLWTASMSISNPTTRTVRDVGLSFRIGSYLGQGGCPAAFPITQTGERLNFEPGIWRSI